MLIQWRFISYSQLNTSYSSDEWLIKFIFWQSSFSIRGLHTRKQNRALLKHDRLVKRAS